MIIESFFIDLLKIARSKVKNYLFQSIDRIILETILVCDASNDISDSIKRKCQGSTKVKCTQLQALRSEFEALAMKDMRVCE